ncbi:FtsK/SpoIIIE domain-containing protein, partial [Lacticaseibacillus rhamnosus]
QEQKQLDFDLAKFNPTLIVGSAGYGKSVALQTIITNLAKANNPEQVQFYLLDFGTNGLLPLVGLPHVGDIAGFDNLEKLGKLLKKLSKLVDDRQATFQDKSVSNLAQYEELTGESLPVTVVAIDAYDTVVENDDQRNGIDLVITKLLREGQALGIYTIMTANRYNSFRVGITSNITTRIGLYMVDDNAPRDMLGREVLKQSPIPGRGQMEVNGEMLAFQIYTPSEHNDSLKIVQDLRQLGKNMNESWQGKVPEKVAMLPREVTKNYFYQQPSVQKMLEDGGLPLALAKESTLALGFIPNQMHYYLLMTETIIQENVSEQVILNDIRMIQQAHPNVELNMIDPDDHLGDYEGEQVTVVPNDELQRYLEWLRTEISERREQGNYDDLYVYIPKVDLMSPRVTMPQPDIESILKQAWTVGIYLIFQTNQLEFTRAFNNLTKALKKNIPAGAISSRIMDQQLIKAGGQYHESIVGEDELNVFVGRQITRAKLITRWQDE